MSRYTASFYHLCISLVVFSALTYLVLFQWYPDFFYAIDGGWEGMRIIIGVDLVLGPLLTLLIFKAGKPGLKFDLACIGIFQSLCLIAGTYIVYNERPIFFIYYDKHFYSSNAETYARYNHVAPDPALFSETSPAIVISKLPDDPIEEADFRRILFQGGLPAWAYEKTYQPLEPYMDQVLKEAYPLQKLKERDTDNKIDQWIADHGGTLEDYAFYPIHSRYRDPFVAIDRRSKTFVDILEIPAPLANAPK